MTAEDRVNAVVKFGFTERQARFLGDRDAALRGVMTADMTRVWRAPCARKSSGQRGAYRRLLPRPWRRRCRSAASAGGARSAGVLADRN